MAAEGGHMDVLVWAHEHGCPLSEEVCFVAAEYGRLGVLQWARENGCPLSRRSVSILSRSTT